MVDYAILMTGRHWPDVAERAIVSIRQFSDAPIVLIDDASPDLVSRLGFERLHKVWSRSLSGCRSECRLQHGLALDLALMFTAAPWVITCDHDVIVNEGGFDVLLDKAADDVGAVGRMYNNAACGEFGTYVHPHWSLWNAAAIREHNLSFAPFQLRRRDGTHVVFATAQFLSYRLQTLGASGSGWAAPGEPLKLVPVNLEKVITHAQVWRERGESWRERVKL